MLDVEEALRHLMTDISVGPEAIVHSVNQQGPALSKMRFMVIKCCKRYGMLGNNVKSKCPSELNMVIMFYVLR